VAVLVRTVRPAVPAVVLTASFSTKHAVFENQRKKYMWYYRIKMYLPIAPKRQKMTNPSRHMSENEIL
jgi:hypothetical protein